LKIVKSAFKSHEDVFCKNCLEEMLERITAPRGGEKRKMEASG
jgi:hypothetical protein